MKPCPLCRFYLFALSCLLAVAHLRADEKSPSPSADGAIHVKAEAAADLVKENKVTVLDVRTPDEFKDGHIAGAMNVDFSDDGFESKIAALDKSKAYLVHCAGGGRSTRSLKSFKKLGFEKIYHLDDGLSGWEEAGKPVEK